MARKTETLSTAASNGQARLGRGLRRLQGEDGSDDTIEVTSDLTTFVCIQIGTAQIKRDRKLKALVEAMADACLFAEQAESLAKLSKSQTTVANRILHQVIECTYFVRAYCKEGSLGMYVALLHYVILLANSF